MPNTGQSVPIPRHYQTRAKNAGLVTLETYYYPIPTLLSLEILSYTYTHK